MMPPGPNSPIVFGMQERVRRGLIEGHMYVVFFKGQKIVGEFRGRFDPNHAIIKTRVNMHGIMTTVNFIFADRWVFTLEETTTFLN